MGSRYPSFFAFALAGLLIAGPALAQSTSTSTTAPPDVAAPKTATTSPGHPTSDSDQAFMTGLRRIGVMAGQVVQCAPEKDRQAEIADAMDLADLVAVHFGLAAAFNFSGAVGYGSGKPFDKAGCAEATAGWNAIKQKYLDQ
jgi:hypothetical protein